MIHESLLKQLVIFAAIGYVLVILGTLCGLGFGIYWLIQHVRFV